MSFFKVIISLPVILAKIVWRFVLISVLVFPVTSFAVVPAINENRFEDLTIIIVITAILALIVSIRFWKKSYENRSYGEKWVW